jgi:hypothetical protein
VILGASVASAQQPGQQRQQAADGQLGPDPRDEVRKHHHQHPTGEGQGVAHLAGINDIAHAEEAEHQVDKEFAGGWQVGPALASHLVRAWAPLVGAHFVGSIPAGGPAFVIAFVGV